MFIDHLRETAHIYVKILLVTYTRADMVFYLTHEVWWLPKDSQMFET